MINHIVTVRSRGNSALAQLVDAKIILKGVMTDNYQHDSDDDPVIIEKLHAIAKELRVDVKEDL